MDLLSGFRHYFGQKAVVRAMVHNVRRKKYTSLDQARTIGIIYEYSGANYHRLIQILKSDPFSKMEVHLLGYVPKQSTKKEELGRGVFSCHDLNWIFIPEKNPEVKHFLEKRFDILFDLSPQDHIPLLYVMASSRTSLSVSVHSNRKKKIADMMIHLNDTPEMEMIFKHMIHYLNQIQSAT
ncbi:MAG: hypothetical protein EOM18_17815 [Clostridia bacterium]|nr:hypothetical protein [Clostridia bacterium]